MDIMNQSIQEILETIARHCPHAMSTFIQVINRQDLGTVFFSKELILNDLSESYTRFRRHIKALARENLLMWAELDGGIQIQLGPWYEDLQEM